MKTQGARYGPLGIGLLVIAMIAIFVGLAAPPPSASDTGQQVVMTSNTAPQIANADSTIGTPVANGVIGSQFNVVATIDTSPPITAVVANNSVATNYENLPLTANQHVTLAKNDQVHYNTAVSTIAQMSTILRKAGVCQEPAGLAENATQISKNKNMASNTESERMNCFGTQLATTLTGIGALENFA